MMYCIESRQIFQSTESSLETLGVGRRKTPRSSRSNQRTYVRESGLCYAAPTKRNRPGSPLERIPKNALIYSFFVYSWITFYHSNKECY